MRATDTIRRPVIRYHGGKWRLAPWIISHFPAHRVYCEPFGGGGSVLMRKPATFSEIYNDVDDRLVNVFRVLRDREKAEELLRVLTLTPFARSEFELAYTEADPGDDVEAARRTIVTSFMGFGSDSIGRGYRTGFRAKANRSNTTPAHDWVNYPEEIRKFHARLMGVVIEHQQAIDCLLKHDGPDTLHYVDPPYVHATRSASRGRHGYRHELTDEQHRTLAAVLHTLDGMVVLSGYDCPMYTELYGSWERVSIETFADGGNPRTEVLWMNAACHAGQRQRPLAI